MPIDASGTPQAPVLIATGRVPVFDAAANATTGAITACPWAPGGAMQPQSQVRCSCRDCKQRSACGLVRAGPAAHVHASLTLPPFISLPVQYYVTYVARDKYGRADGLCPGQLAGAAPRVCTDLAFTGS